MHILSVNVGKSRTVSIGGRDVATAIYKTPVSGAHRVEGSGLIGDERVDKRPLGDSHHAVYAYPHEHYGYFEKQLGRYDFELGQFGENLTVVGLPETAARIGDLLRCGSALLQVAHPRIPCKKLDHRMGSAFARAFLESRRVGYYLRVREPGWLRAGDPIVLLDRDEASPTVDTFVRVSQFDYWNPDELEALLTARDLPPGWREVLMDKLARAQSAAGWFGMRELVVTRRRAHSDGWIGLCLACGQGKPLPPFVGGQQLTLAFRPPELGARTLRQALPAERSPLDDGQYAISLWPDAEPDSLVHALAKTATPGTRLRAEAARGGLNPQTDNPHADTDVLCVCEPCGSQTLIGLIQDWAVSTERLPLQLLCVGGPLPEVAQLALARLARAPTVETVASLTHGTPHARPTTRIYISGRRAFVEQVREHTRALGWTRDRCETQVL